MVVSLTLNHRRKPTVGRADPPVVPVTDEISPNKNSQLIRGQAFRIVAVIEKLAFHSGPHAFTSSIIVAPATITVHALYNAIFRKRLTVGFTGILSSSVGVHNGTSQIRMRQIGIILSDDGSTLTIDSEQIVDNDGPHGPKEIVGQKALAKGYHPMELRYFDQNGGQLKLKVTGSDGKEIPFTHLYAH